MPPVSLCLSHIPIIEQSECWAHSVNQTYIITCSPEVLCRPRLPLAGTLSSRLVLAGQSRKARHKAFEILPIENMSNLAE